MSDPTTRRRDALIAAAASDQNVRLDFSTNPPPGLIEYVLEQFIDGLTWRDVWTWLIHCDKMDDAALGYRVRREIERILEVTPAARPTPKPSEENGEASALSAAAEAVGSRSAPAAAPATAYLA